MDWLPLQGADAVLLFKAKFLPAIRSGAKRQTIRLWKHRMMRAGQRSYIPGFGPVRITSVERIHLDLLTDADALPDGFGTADELREELHRLYDEATLAERRAYRVVFEPAAE